MTTILNLARGERVCVISEDRILATLDARGELDGLPFMPEMLRFCGRQMRVRGRADKTCDTISGSLRSRRMKHAVHLEESRCDGAAHGGCDADCLLFWKEAWLQRMEAPRVHPLWRYLADPDLASQRSATNEGCTRSELERGAIGSSTPAGDVHSYRCQTTQLLEATAPLSPRDISQYLRDWLSGNIPLDYILKIALLRRLRRIVVWGRGFKIKVKAYNAVAGFFGEPDWPYYAGLLTGRTPVEHLDLAPGEWVKIKSHEEIRATLNDKFNRGMSFSAEMVRYCGKTYRVRARVERILDERTGEMVSMKNDCILLEDVICRSECSTGRLFCPRAIYPYWREIWLQRTQPPADSSLEDVSNDF